MDILSQYKQEHPEAFQEKKSSPMTDEYGRAYTGMIAFVIRISGGRIRDARQASMALLAASVIIAIGALIVFFLSSGTQNTLPKNLEQINQSQYANPN